MDTSFHFVFLCQANRKIHEGRDNEAQCAVGNLCFCITNRNGEKETQAFFNLDVCLSFKQDSGTGNVLKEKITWLCHIDVFPFQNHTRW